MIPLIERLEMHTTHLLPCVDGDALLRLKDDIEDAAKAIRNLAGIIMDEYPSTDCRYIAARKYLEGF